MGRPKGGKNRKYSVDDKLRIVKMNTVKYLPSREISRLTGISAANIRRWIKNYEENGIDGLSPKEGRGNKFSALHVSKSLTKQQRLELENLKLRIENERLKKGYQVKGGGANKEYVSIYDKNMKSLNH